MKKLHFCRFLGIVAALITAAVQHVYADVSPPVKISVPRDTISAPVENQEFRGVFEVAVGEHGTLEQVGLRGEGWTIVEMIPSPPFHLGAGEIATFTYRAIPRDPTKPLTAHLIFNSQAVRREITVTPQRFAEIGKARPSSRVPGSSGLRPGADPNPPAPSSLAGGGVNLRFTGRIIYTRSDGAMLGADGVYFEIRDDDSPSFDETIVSGHTDVNGSFDVTTNWDDCDVLGCDEPDIYLYYEADTGVATVQTADILEDDYDWDTEDDTHDNFAGNFLDFGVLSPTDTGEHPALFILSNITRVHRFLLTRDGTHVPHVDVRWPESDDGAFYNALYNEIHIGPNAQWNEGTIIHEWGHHFLETQSVNLTPDYCNGFCDNEGCNPGTCGLTENGGHCQWCPETNHDAWNEGFPNWLGSVVMRSLAADYPMDYPAMRQPLAIMDNRYTLEMLGLCCQDSTNYVGQADITEGFASALLGDVEDANPVTDNHVMDPAPDCSMDAMSLGVDEILQVTRMDLPTNPLDFINKFRVRFPQHEQDFWSTCANVSSVYLSQFPLPTPKIVTQSQGCEAYVAGETLMLNVQGNGSLLRYQWRRNGMNLMDGGSISNATMPTLTINPLATTDAGLYDCIVTTCDGTLSTTSAPIRVTVYAALGGGTNVAGFGRNDLGQLGNGQTVVAGDPSLPPTPVLNLSQVVQISTSDSRSIALRSDGTVWTWGDDPSFQNGFTTSAQQVPGLTGVIAVAAGGEGAIGIGHFLALKDDGTVHGWGSNSFGQLGYQNISNAPNPVPVPGLDCVVSISAGGNTSYAVRSDGTVWSFGFNGHGELGRGTIGGWSGMAGSVVGINDAVSVSAGIYHALVVRGNGTALSWGRNLEGQLGDGTNQHRPSPVAVLNLTGVTAVRGGTFSSYAIASGGSLHVWGGNLAGQLGTGESFNTYYAPIVNPHIPAVIDVSAGHQHAVFLRPDQTVWVAGSNIWGSLISGGAGNILTPQQVPSLINVSAVEAGQTHSFALAPGVRPTITQQPQSQSVFLGQSAQFTVTALGNPTLTYRWSINGTTLFDGGAVSGANSPTLMLNPIAPEHAGSLVVHIDNLFGGTMSMPATITIQCAPTDVNCDGVIDANDAGGFVDCVNGPAPGAPIPPICMPMEFDAADVDGDNDVDLEDVAGLQRCFNPGGPPVIGCAP